MCGRVIQSSGPLRYGIVDGLDVRDNRVHNYPPRWNAAPSQDLLVIRMMAQMSSKDGFIAALDQSGGSTPAALRLYGIPDNDYAGEPQMFKIMHEFRVRIITSPAFNGQKVLGSILFERTMDGEVKGKPVPGYLWEDRGVVPFVKVDKGLAAEKDGVSLMNPMPDLEPLLERAIKRGVFGTKMRSFINLASQEGIAAVVEQQFDIADQIAPPSAGPNISLCCRSMQSASATAYPSIVGRRRLMNRSCAGNTNKHVARSGGLLRRSNFGAATKRH